MFDDFPKKKNEKFIEMNHEYQKINKFINKKKKKKRKLENEKSHTLLCIACRINVGKKKKKAGTKRSRHFSFLHDTL